MSEQDIIVAKPAKKLTEVLRRATDVEAMVDDILKDPRYKRSIVVPICDKIPELRDKYSSATGKDRERASKYIAISLVVCKWAEMLGITDGENIKFELSVEFTVDKTLSVWLQRHIDHKIVPLATLYRMVTDKSVVEIIKNLNNTKSTLLHLSIATCLYNEFKLDLRFAGEWLNKELLTLSQAKTMLERCLNIYNIIAPTKDKHNSYKFISFLQEYVKVKEIDELIPYNIHPDTLTRNFVAWLIQNSDTVNAEVFEKLSSHLIAYNRSPKEIRELFALHQTIGINTTQQGNVEYVNDFFKTNCSTLDVDKLDRWRKLPTVEESYNKYLHKAIEDCMLYLSKEKLKSQVQNLEIKPTVRSDMIADLNQCKSLDGYKKIRNRIANYLKKLEESQKQSEVDEQKAERARRHQAALQRAESERKAREELENTFKQEQQRMRKEAKEAIEQERLAQKEAIERARREAEEELEQVRREAEETVQKRVTAVTTESQKAIEAAENKRRDFEKEAQTKAQEAERLRLIEVQKAKEAAAQERKRLEEEAKRKLEATERERQALAEEAKHAKQKEKQHEEESKKAAEEQQRLVQRKEAELQQQAQISRQGLQHLITIQKAEYERSIGELNEQLESGRLDNQHLLQQLQALKQQEQRQKRNFSERFAALTKTYRDETEAFDNAIESMKRDLTCKNTVLEDQLKATHQSSMEELTSEKEAIKREVDLERNELKRRESELDTQYQQLVGVKAIDADMKQLQHTYFRECKRIAHATHSLNQRYSKRLGKLEWRYQNRRNVFNREIHRLVTASCNIATERRQRDRMVNLDIVPQDSINISTSLDVEPQPQEVNASQITSLRYMNLLTSTHLMTASYATMLTISLYRVLS
jgi:myosin heavy subunit